jgi:hypothetical protein
MNNHRQHLKQKKKKQSGTENRHSLSPISCVATDKQYIAYSIFHSLMWIFFVSLSLSILLLTTKPKYFYFRPEISYTESLLRQVCTLNSSRSPTALPFAPLLPPLYHHLFWHRFTMHFLLPRRIILWTFHTLFPSLNCLTSVPLTTFDCLHYLTPPSKTFFWSNRQELCLFH